MKPEDLVEKLKTALEENLESVILYGSAAEGDFIEKKSDYNVLVVSKSLGAEELRRLMKPVKDWMKSGNPSPLLFTRKRLAGSADVFPLELLDIKDHHAVLYGEDVIAGIDISTAYLRHELEYELKSKLLRLREGYIQTGGYKKRIVDLMVNSVSTFMVLFRGVLRLLNEPDIPNKKTDALRKLSSKLEFNPGVFDNILELKAGKHSTGSIDAERIFREYLEIIETVVDKVDNILKTPENS